MIEREIEWLKQLPDWVADWKAHDGDMVRAIINRLSRGLPKPAQPVSDKTVGKLEEKVLRVLVEHDEMHCQSFAVIAGESGVPRNKLRRAVRGLARKGFAEFHRALWTEDGDPAGSGYCGTTKGRAFLETLDAKRGDK